MDTKPTEHTEYHKDGSIWAKGQMLAGEPTGYWEWFRKEGTIMRSGHFEAGQPVGQWITFDRQGQVYKITNRTTKKDCSKSDAP